MPASGDRDGRRRVTAAVPLAQLHRDRVAARPPGARAGRPTRRAAYTVWCRIPRGRPSEPSSGVPHRLPERADVWSRGQGPPSSCPAGCRLPPGGPCGRVRGTRPACLMIAVRLDPFIPTVWRGRRRPATPRGPKVSRRSSRPAIPTSRQGRKTAQAGDELLAGRPPALRPDRAVGFDADPCGDCAPRPEQVSRPLTAPT